MTLELFIRFTVLIYRGSVSVCVRVFSPFGFQGGMWDLTALVTDHRLYSYFVNPIWCCYQG